MIFAVPDELAAGRKNHYKYTGIPTVIGDVTNVPIYFSVMV